MEWVSSSLLQKIANLITKKKITQCPSYSLDPLTLESTAAASPFKFDSTYVDEFVNTFTWEPVAELVINISKQTPVSFTTSRWQRYLQQPWSYRCQRLTVQRLCLPGWRSHMFCGVPDASLWPKPSGNPVFYYVWKLYYIFKGRLKAYYEDTWKLCCRFLVVIVAFRIVCCTVPLCWKKKKRLNMLSSPIFLFLHL